MGAMNELTQVIWLIAPAAVLLFLGVYFVGQAGAVRRTLLSTLLLEQMSALIRLGLPLRRGLEPCEREIGRASRRDLEEVEAGLAAGELLGDALASVPSRGVSLRVLIFRFLCLVQFRPVPRLVSPAEAEALRIGERSGDLLGALDLVLRRRRRSHDIRRMLWNSLFYPLFAGMAAAALLGSVSIYIVPKMARMFEELDLALPTWTQRVIDLPYAHLYGCAVFAALFIFLIVRLAQLSRPLTPGRRSLTDWTRRILFLLPFIRGATRRLFLIEFCCEAAMLLRMGTPADRALEVIAEGTVHPVYQGRLMRAVEWLRRGEPLADSLEKAGFDGRVVMTVRMAESASDLPEALRSLGEEFAARSNWASNMVVQIVPPILILVLGLLIAAVVVGLFLPLVRLTYALSGSVG